MQIIHESTGGRIPRYWRPPYGDSDNRVRAIAKEVRIVFISWEMPKKTCPTGFRHGYRYLESRVSVHVLSPSLFCSFCL
jgi:peptidoglycan/xylan/chitin deacetylase (PgdA/CDA1 family)